MSILASTAMAEPKRDFIDDLVPALTASADAGAVLAKAPPTVTVRGNGPWTVSIAARDTQGVLAAWGWQDVYAVSGDVHQRSFSIRKHAGSLGADRIATVEPHAGRWSLRVRLVSRPPGDLPTWVAGASPAYPLPHYASQIEQVEIRSRTVAEIETALSAYATQVTRELGPHDRDLGSGMHVLEYVLGQDRLHVGTPDDQMVMYIIVAGAGRVGTRDLYRKK